MRQMMGEGLGRGLASGVAAAGEEAAVPRLGCSLSRWRRRLSGQAKATAQTEQRWAGLAGEEAAGESVLLEWEWLDSEPALPARPPPTPPPLPASCVFRWSFRWSDLES